MVRRTNINLDSDLVAEAAVLGTDRITDTVHTAMREIVAQHHRRPFAERDLFGTMTHEELEELRRGRVLGA